MSTPVDELPPEKKGVNQEKKEEKEEKEKDTKHGDDISPVDNDTHAHEPSGSDGNHLRVDTEIDGDHDMTSLRSPSAARERYLRLEDDLALLEAERVASVSTKDDDKDGEKKSHSSASRIRSRPENVDAFDEATNPLHEKAAVYNPPEKPNTKLSVFIKKLHSSSFIVRYATYIIPVVLVLLIPLLVGALAFPNASVGGVELLWFSVWLEIVWLTLWAGRVCHFS